MAATQSEGTLQAIQRVFLTPDALNVQDAGGRKKKLTRGCLAGAAVRLPGPLGGPLLLSEGPESGLSVWVPTGFETWIALGSIASLTPPPGRTLLVCIDDDPHNSPGQRLCASPLAIGAARGGQSLWSHRGQYGRRIKATSTT